jgi:hypothetical protein
MEMIHAISAHPPLGTGQAQLLVREVWDQPSGQALPVSSS